MAKKKKSNKQARELTEQQKQFVVELIKNNFNAKQAAISAGYSEKTADSQASRLLKNVKVLEYKEKLLAKARNSTVASIEEILEYFTRTMRREEKENVVVTTKKKMSGFVTVPETGKRERKTIEEEKAEIVEIPTRVSDANKAAEMLGKYYGLWTEKIDLDSEQKVTFVDDLEEEDSEG